MLARKFYRLSGLTNIFKLDGDVFMTSVDGMGGFTQSFLDEYTQKIDKHTLLFITATEADAGKFVKLTSEQDGVKTSLMHKLRVCDTLIWVRGQVYAISTKTVISVTFEQEDSNLLITYSDGNQERIHVSAEGGGAQYIAGDNIIISEQKVISAIGYLFDDAHNFVEDPDCNSVVPGISHAHVEGEANIANTDNQHVSGKYAKSDSTKIMIVGWGDADNRDNIFTISKLGVAYVKNDVTCGGVSEEFPDYRLQDIHSVFDSDWEIIGFETNSFDDNDFNNSYK